MEGDDTVSWCMKMINDKANKIRLLAEEYPNLGVLGTTSAAAFVDSIVPSNVQFFTDENPKRIGLNFHSKEVVCPSSLRNGDVVAIPYGDVSMQIKERFSKKYNGQFVCL